MKRIISFLLIVSLLLCLSACDRPVLPPVRVTENMMFVSLAVDPTFSNAVEADLIAHVKIGNWLGEDSDGFNRTFFEAEVLHVFKGEEKEKITVIQEGSSEATAFGYPLYIYGNEWLLFLNKATDEPYEDAYYTLGLWHYPFFAAPTEEGYLYLGCEYGIGQDLPQEDNYAENGNTERYVEAYKFLKEADPLLGGYFMYAYTKEDLTRYIQEYIEN